METIIHKAEKRGYSDHGWLQSHHSFSFADYHNPEKMHFGKLRVLNDDKVGPSKGFGMHAHRDMEIITIPLQGALKHSDNLGNEKVIKSGEVQVMTAGTGVMHSEYNASDTEDVHFLQLWIFSDQLGHKPRYGQKLFADEGRRGRWQLLVTPDGREESLKIHQHAFISAMESDSSDENFYLLNHPGNGLYLFIMNGAVQVNGNELENRDAIGLWEISQSLQILFHQPAQLLAIEVPMR